MDTLLKLANVEFVAAPPEAYVRMARWLGQPDEWWRMMPSSAHTSFMKGLVNKVRGFPQALPTDYFCDTWVPGNDVLRALQPARIDVDRLHRRLMMLEGNVPALASFVPGPSGFAIVPDYDRLSTVTGRLTVTHGPQILTLKRSHRDVIVPSTEAGAIVWLDFSALEVRVAVQEAGRSCDVDDVYGAMALEVGKTREQVKKAVICELYGASRHVLSRALELEGSKLDEFLVDFRRQFDVKNVKDRLHSEYLKTGLIKNRFGRPIVVNEPLPHVMLNHFVQSTGVDVSLLGFKQLIDRLPSLIPGARPLFVLHDALCLDVPRESIPATRQPIKVKIDGYRSEFPLKATVQSYSDDLLA